MMSESGYFYHQEQQSLYSPAYHGLDQDAKTLRSFQYYGDGTTNNFQPHTSASINMENSLHMAYSSADHNSNNIQSILTNSQMLPSMGTSQIQNSATPIISGNNKPSDGAGMCVPSTWPTPPMPANAFDHNMAANQAFNQRPLSLPHPPQGTSPTIDIGLVTAQGQKRPRGEKKPIPGEQKDVRYFERRKRNNQAAKRSRDARKSREDEIAIRASFLEKENAVLRAQTATLREEANSLKQLLLQKTARYRLQ